MYAFVNMIAGRSPHLSARQGLVAFQAFWTLSEIVDRSAQGSRLARGVCVWPGGLGAGERFAALCWDPLRAGLVPTGPG